ncbi:cyclic-di-AMP-binding protein CbpB [Lacticaseibacillus nasuensis]|uniref:cyclic-di-AMP-binding protein CbpB n=1 Tax=Lacticaseibacillus nasuensis TaxID=944671 RepID=UPI002248109B|nr:cyclic-di-AMP-binding protein CbpB [Lacticaseibacillus nasuensis]MCX2454420.1 CBS domain-containing protein [Lacticaseibacillus nasuensis]
MMNQAIDTMLIENRKHFMIPGEMVASVNADNALRHAFLVLTKVRYAKVPVLDNDDHFLGLISLAMITEPMLGLDDINLKPLDELCVKDVMETGVPTIEDPYDVENVLHLLVDSPFLPVVQDDGTFTGIVTRREVMKGINYIGHNIDKRYDMTPLPPAEA